MSNGKMIVNDESEESGHGLLKSLKVKTRLKGI